MHKNTPKWYSVKDRPLFIEHGEPDEDGETIEITKDGERDFMAAVPLVRENKWWIGHCLIDSDDGTLRSICDDCGTSPCGWELSDVTHWMPITYPTI